MITDEDDIKRLVKSTIASADLTSAVIAGDRKIVALTGRDIEDWDPTDNIYGQLQAVGAAYGAWSILFGWDEKMYGNKAKEAWKAYEFEVNQFRSTPLADTQTNPNIDIAESDYTHYKLNPEYKPFLSEY